MHAMHACVACDACEETGDKAKVGKAIYVLGFATHRDMIRTTPRCP